MDYCFFKEYRKTKYGTHLVEETLLDTLAYSVVHLNEEGKTIVAIGMNPRGTQPISSELRHLEKEGLKENGSLELTRQKAIYLFSERFNYSDFKQLIQLDLFSLRTHQSPELFTRIKKATPDELRDTIIGSDNIEVIEKEIEQGDYILLDWGAGLNWQLMPAYAAKLKNLLWKNREKLFWLGKNLDGSPKHPNYHGKLELQPINENDIENIFK